LFFSLFRSAPNQSLDTQHFQTIEEHKRKVHNVVSQLVGSFS
jgi:hypothetical protein